VTPANALAYYPGDDVVDIISQDVYFQTSQCSDSHTCWNNVLSGNGNMGLTDWANFAAAHNKPMAVWEWGDTFSDGYNITQFSNWMKAHNIVAHSYWDTADGLSGATARLQAAPARQAAYVAAWQNWQPTTTFWGTLLPTQSLSLPGY
jgi:Glycosyl hydrolase family 26